jgi:hypothetical protein
MNWQNGPDKIHPAKSFTSTRLDEAVKLRVTNHLMTPVSIYSIFKKTVERHPDKTALGKFLKFNQEQS